MKPNNTIRYINKESNHPPSVLKNIPQNVNNRITRNSKNEEVFNASIQPYKDALSQSGFNNNNLNFDPNVKQQQQQKQQKRKRRGRKITWFNPPFSLNVKTNIGKIFLQLIKECFPKTHILHKICNKNTLKLSYRTMPNISSHISKHNNKILQQNLQQTLQQQNLKHEELAARGIPHCNCRNKAGCVMPDKCMNSNLVYRYTVTRSDTNHKETYTGCTVGFKKRHDKHMRQSVSDKYGSTTLSSYIKSLRASNVPFDINWECEERGAPFNVITGWCRLCTLEKLHILSNPEGASLNQRSEFFSHCFHKDPQLLINRKIL